MRLLFKVFVIVLTINIAIIAIFFAENLITRYPDLYSFEFKNTEIFNEIDLVYDEEDMADVFSNYLFGKVNEFQVIAEYQGREIEIFTNQEQISMEKLKAILDLHFIIAIVFLVLTSTIIYYMISKGSKQMVRLGYNYSLILFSVSWLIIMVTFFTGWLYKIINYYIFTGINDSEQVLGYLLNQGFVRDWLFFTLFASGIIMLITRMIIWKYTKERRMFI